MQAFLVDQQRSAHLVTYLIHLSRPAWAFLRAWPMRGVGGRDIVAEAIVHIHQDFAATCFPSLRSACLHVVLLDLVQGHHAVLVSSSLSVVA